MSISIKNPVYVFLLNWIILLVGHLGIPLIQLEGSTIGQQYILSFLVMNFNFLGVDSNLFLLITSWSISIPLFGIFMKKDWKIPIYTLGVELFVYLFSIILMKRNIPLTYALIKIDLLKGFGIISAAFSTLYIPILIHLALNKLKQKPEKKLIQIKSISSCPHCGMEYHSNPQICYSCSKRINTS